MELAELGGDADKEVLQARRREGIVAQSQQAKGREVSEPFREICYSVVCEVEGREVLHVVFEVDCGVRVSVRIRGEVIGEERRELSETIASSKEMFKGPNRERRENR